MAGRGAASDLPHGWRAVSLESAGKVAQFCVLDQRTAEKEGKGGRPDDPSTLFCTQTFFKAGNLSLENAGVRLPSGLPRLNVSGLTLRKLETASRGQTVGGGWVWDSGTGA